VKAAKVTSWLVLTSVLATTTGLVVTRDEARSGARSALIHLPGLSRAPCRPRSASCRARYRREVPTAVLVASPASRSTARCCEIVGLVTGNAAAMSPADSSVSQIRDRISRRTGELSAASTFWMSRTLPPRCRLPVRDSAAVMDPSKSRFQQLRQGQAR
jgi:hypothetical protein